MLFPKREKKLPELPPLPQLEEPEFPKYESRAPLPKLPKLPPLRTQPQMRESRNLDEPVFVKIDKYKNAVSSLSDIQSKVKEAEAAMKKLNELKELEDREMTHWHETVESIKDKLLSIDKKLFEVK
ncbi:hypothetical protein CL618_02325 [archaeon]|nr:hypothetical protein [archaeon]